MTTPDIIADIEPLAWRYKYQGGKWTVQKNKPHWYKDFMVDVVLEPLFTSEQLLTALSEANEKTLLHQSDAKMAWGECEAERQRADRAEAERDAALVFKAKAIELLKPFAQVAANFPIPTASRQDSHIWCAYVDDAITYGDLRAAASFLENTNGK